MADAPMDRELQKSMTLAFAPVHKRALGVAAGLTFGTLLALVTLPLELPPASPFGFSPDGLVPS